MSKYYMSHDIDNMLAKRQGDYYLVDNFNSKIRLEAKLAYLAILNELLDFAKFNASNEAYLDLNLSSLANRLAKLANKQVDEAKMKKYLDELQVLDLLDLNQNQCYLKRLI